MIHPHPQSEAQRKGQRAGEDTVIDSLSSFYFIRYMIFEVKSQLKLPVVKPPTDLVLSFAFNLIVRFISQVDTKLIGQVTLLF